MSNEETYVRIGCLSMMFSLGCSNCMLTFVLLLCGIVLAKESSNGQLQQENHNCRPWMYFSNATQSFQCGPILHHMISCLKDGNRSEVGVLFRFCMTQNNEKTKVVVGACPYNRGRHTYEAIQTYRSLPRNVTQLDREMCGLTARTGQLCGKCMEDCSLPVYSYYPQCVNCTGDTNNWAMYLAVSLMPTTAFFAGALVFRFRATSPLLNGYIMACQIVTSPPIQRLVAFRDYDRYYTNIKQTILFYEIYFGCLSIWNLDFSEWLHSFLLASRCLHTTNTVSGLHHSRLPSRPHHPHLHTSQTPLPQLHVHLWCGCGGPSSDALLVVDGSGTFKTHLWMPLQLSSSSPTSSF